MTTTQLNDGVPAIERLLTICSDGVEGYRRATASIRAPDLHSMLQRNEVEREEIASVFTNALVEIGGKHEHRGSLTGALHRGWLGALQAMHADDEIVRECLRGEGSTLEAFTEALTHELPPALRDCVIALRGRVSAALERLSEAHRSLRAELR